MEMSTHEVVNFFLGERMQVLELVECSKLLNVESVGCDDVRGAF